MIEELKELVAVLNSLPQLALWVALGFWAYKVLIIGSIYGLIRFVVQRTFDGWKLYKERPKEVVWKLGDVCISEDVARRLQSQLLRMRFGAYLHQSHVEKLSALIDKVLSEEKAP